MLIKFIYPLLLLSYVKHALSVSVFINITSQFTFDDKIIKAEIIKLNGI
jgi:hypothetical protein